MLGPGFEAPAGGALPAVVDVIDIATHKIVRSIPVHFPVHNTYVTPDDKYLVAGLRGDPDPGEPAIQVIDAATDKVVWGIELTGHSQYGRENHEVRPMAFEANPDGSTKRMFAQATAINGVLVVDWNTRKVVTDPLAAEAAVVEAERRRHSNRRHARPRSASQSDGGLGVEPAR